MESKRDISHLRTQYDKTLESYGAKDSTQKARKIFQELKDFASRKAQPFVEIFVRMFLNECERLVKAGLKSDYLCIAQNRAFLKGKLEFKEHITQNLIHKERFFTSSDEYTQDIAPNRLIHSTLRILSRLNLSPSTQTKLDSMHFIFADISSSENIESDFAKCGNMSRAKEYEMIISWCKVFLEQRAFSPYAGGDKAMAFLFPMEKLFESFVGFWLKKCAKGFSVKTQERVANIYYKMRKIKTYFA